MSATKNAPWYSPVLSLRWRLTLVTTALFAIFVAILSIFLYSSISNSLLDNAQSSFRQHAQALAIQSVLEACNGASPQTMTMFIQQNSNDIDEIYLLNRAGVVVISSTGDLLNRPLPSFAPSFFTNAPPQVTQAFKSQTANGKTGDGQLLSLQVPGRCAQLYDPPAYIALLTSYTSENDTLRNIALTLMLVSIVMICVSALILFLFTGIVLTPLKQVIRATRALAHGNLQQRVPLAQSQDEIGTLAISFNQMADRIEQMFVAQQESEQRTQRFVSDASHELRTPITSLRGFTEVLIRGAKDDPATTQHILSLMKSEAERMSNLVNDLLTLARLDEGRFPAAESIDLIDIAVECLQQARKRMPEGCKLALELATQEHLKISASREPISQLLMVLLDNAMKYGCAGEQRKILLRLDKKANQALVQVVDEGMGISAEDLPHVFDRFYRGENAHRSGKASIPGTGLGLAIAQAIAQTYHGAITVASEVDHETTFTATFLCVE